LPLSILLIEPTLKRRRRMLGFVILGGLLALYILWGLIVYPLQISMAMNGIVCLNRISTTAVIAVLYAIATCGPLFFSGFRGLALFGWLDVAGLVTVMLVRRLEFTSIWCFYSAVVSVILYFFFRQTRLVRPFGYLKKPKAA
jgi:hypothetical protein